MPRNVSQTFSIPLSQLDRLQKVAEQERSTMSGLVQQAIEIVLSKYESSEAREKVDTANPSSGGGHTRNQTAG